MDENALESDGSPNKTRVQYSDSFGNETATESVCSGWYGPEMPARRQQVEEMKTQWDEHCPSECL